MQTHLATSWLEVASLVALCSGSVLYRHRLALGRTVMLPSRAILRQCPQVMQTGFSPRRFLVRQLLTVPPTPSRTAACHWSRKSKFEQETLLRMPLTLELLPCAWESLELLPLTLELLPVTLELCCSTVSYLIEGAHRPIVVICRRLSIHDTTASVISIATEESCFSQ